MNWTELLKTHLKELIKIDTSNPPGNETAAADYIAKVFKQAGIPFEIVEPLPGRGSIVARLKGDGSERPLLLLAHLDVVLANDSEWKYPPFSAEEAEGAIWGRGTADTKGLIATWLVLLLKMKAEGIALKRDIIFAATADEEAGGYHGLKWIVENRPELVDSELALNEGGGNALTLGNVTYFTYQPGDKAVCTVTLTARGIASHSCVPSPENPIIKLSSALSELGRAQFPVHMTKTTKAFFKGLADGLPAAQGTALRSAIANEQVAEAIGVAVKDPLYRIGLMSMLANTAVPTMLSASPKGNAIPSRATAGLDCGILPGQTRDSLVEELRAVLPDDIEIEVTYCGLPSESDTDAPLAAIIKDAIEKHQPGAYIIPILSPSATDARYLRPRGTVVYGFAPMLPDEPVGHVHGANERITVASLEFGFRVLDDVVHAVAAK